MIGALSARLLSLALLGAASAAPATPAPRTRFVEAASERFGCLAAEGEGCVQAYPQSALACRYHDDCDEGCAKGEGRAKCATRAELDPSRPPRSNVGGAARRELGQDACIRDDTVNGFDVACGCLPKAKRCGPMTRAYYDASSAKGNRTGGRCARDSDCLIGCKTGSTAATCVSRSEGSARCLDDGAASWGPGGLPCVCLPDVKLCGFALPSSSAPSLK